MRLRTLGFYSVLSLTMAVFSLACEPNHRHGVGIDLDIHSKDYHKDNRDHPKDEGDHHDDHHDKDDHHDDNQ